MIKNKIPGSRKIAVKIAELEKIGQKNRSNDNKAKAAEKFAHKSYYTRVSTQKQY